MTFVVWVFSPLLLRTTLFSSVIVHHGALLRKSNQLHVGVAAKGLQVAAKGLPKRILRSIEHPKSAVIILMGMIYLTHGQG